MQFVPPAVQKSWRARWFGPRRRLWIHAGLHKTGTTSLQSFLIQNRAALAERGILYPQAGTNRYLDGNHNLAWELTGDHRFELDTGGVAEAIDQMAAHPGDAILSSEDFETLLHQPARFAPLLRAAELRGHEVRVLVYLRHQADYLASLLVEAAKHGAAPQPEVAVEEILRSGRLALGDWVFQFDWAAMAACWPWRGARLVLRNYHALEGGSTVADAIGLMAPGLGGTETARLNRSGRKPELEPALAGRLMAHFGPINRRLCERAGISAAGLAE